MRLREVLAVLMAEYDEHFPTATPFQRGSWEYTCKEVLTALFENGFTIEREVKHS